MRYPQMNVMFLTILASCAACIVALTANGLVDWFLSVRMTLPRKILLLTAGIAYESQTVEQVWDRCYSHADGTQLARYECFMVVRSTVIRWCLGIAALGSLTN